MFGKKFLTKQFLKMMKFASEEHIENVRKFLKSANADSEILQMYDDIASIANININQASEIIKDVMDDMTPAKKQSVTLVKNSEKKKKGFFRWLWSLIY